MANSADISNLNYFVALDDRVDICSEILGSTSEPTAAERERAAELKRVVFDGITSSIEHGIAKSSLALWADSDLGESVLLRAKAMSMTTASSPGSGVRSLSRLNIDYTAVQLNMNPDGPKEERKELLHRLKIVSDTASKESIPLMIELDTVPTASQIEIYGGLGDARGIVLLKAMQQLQDAGVNPSIWAFEPVDDVSITEAIAAQANIDDRGNTVLLVVADQLSTEKIGNTVSQMEKRTIRLAARTLGISGLLVGKGVYFGLLQRLNQGIIERDEVVASVAAYLGDISEIFEKSRKTSEVL
jgi:hypothetical protein